jgi:hypothetical protein
MAEKKTAKAKTPKNGEFNELTVKKIKVVADDGSALEISAQKSGLGIWLTDMATGAIICIVAGHGQGVQVSLRTKDATEEGAEGHNLVLAADSEYAYMQFVGNDGKAYYYTVDELIKKLEQGKGLI